MPEPVLDTVVLRVMAFAHPNGIEILLETLNVSRARFPAEVYNRDEASLPWLQHATQLPQHLKWGSLLVDPLTLEELPRREALRTQYGIGRGESACLVLAERYQSQAVFLSSDAAACQVAQALGLSYLTLLDVLEAWVDQIKPPLELFDALLSGMRAAKFSPKAELIRNLQLKLFG